MNGHWLRRSTPRPMHTCLVPADDEPENRDVWQCSDCRLVYIWSNNAGYGFEWRRVFFRAWWFRLMGEA